MRCTAAGPWPRTARYSRTFRNARDLRKALAAFSDAGRDELARPSSMMSAWRRVRRQAESFWAAGLEMNLGRVVIFSIVLSKGALVVTEGTYDVINPTASS